MHARVALLVFFLLPFVGATAQLKEVDSLKILLEGERDPKKRIELISEISYFLYDFDDSAAFQYAQDALKASREIKYMPGVKYAYTLIGIKYFNNGNFSEALASFRLSASVEADAPKRTAYNHVMQGKVYFEMAEYDSARLNLERALAIVLVTNDRYTIANIYRTIGQVSLLQWKNDEAFEYLSKAEEILTKEIRNDYLMTEVCSGLGTYYDNKLQFDQADRYFIRMCELTTLSQDPYHLIKCDLRKSEIDLRTGHFAEAMVHCNEALKKSESYQYPPQIVEVYFKFGEIYMGLSQHEMAVKFFLEALRISESLKLQKWSGDIYSRLAWIQLERVNDEQTLDYINKAEAIRLRIDDKKGLGNVYDVKGLVFYHKKQYDSAYVMLERARVVWEAIGHDLGVSAVYFNISLIYQDKKDFDKALEFRNKTLDIERRVGNKKELSGTTNSIADLLIALKRFEDAEGYLKIASEYANESGSLVQKRDNARTYATLYNAMGDYKKSNDYLMLFTKLNDSIFSERGTAKLAEMEAMYKVEQKEQEIRFLNQENELKENQLNLQRMMTNQQRAISWAAAIGLIIVSWFAWTTYRFNKRIQSTNRSLAEKNEEIQTQTEELTESNLALSRLNYEVTEKNEEIQAQSEELIEAHQTILSINRNLEEEVESRTADLKKAYHELDTFFYRSSHDFRRPLTTFMGLAEVAKITVKDPNALELFERVRETAHNLDKMLVKLQSISDVGGQQLVYKEVFFKELVQEFFSNMRPEMEKKKIVADAVFDLQKPFFSYPALIKIILENLIENAIAFCATDEPRVRVQVKTVDEGVLISVRDNGQGIPQELHSRIFEMYFRGNALSKGNGLGLYIVSKAVDKLQGRIEFESELYSGSMFNVILPGQVN